MKRADEVKDGHGMEKLEVKRSRTEEESSEPSDFNPFLIEPILRKLLKKLDTVAQLKDLRKMCVLWDNVNMEELEDRAFKGKLKAIDFKWTDRFKTKEEAEKEFVEFLEDTRSIPQLFCSFKINIPESLKVLQPHPTFFSDYTIFRVVLTTSYGNLKDLQVLMAIKYMLNLIGANLMEIHMPEPRHPISFEPKTPNWPNPESELLLPKLEKLVIENSIHINEKSRWDQLANFFKSALTGSGSESGHITFLKLVSLPEADIGSFPGLDPARMTRLDIGEEFKGTNLALKYTTGLMTLVEKGMRLKDLGLRFGKGDDTPTSLAQNLPSICSNLTHFFATQSSTLATLVLQMELVSLWPGTDSQDEIRVQVASFGKILLPVFEALDTISFGHRLEIQIANQNQNTLAFSLFEATRQLPLHFPSLVNAKFDSECSMDLFFDHPGQMDLAGEPRFHFKRLGIIHNYYSELFDRLIWNPSESRRNWNMLYGSLIGSVDYLRVPNEILEQVRIPWGDSLRELTFEFVKAPLKLAHLKKLEKLTIVERGRRIGLEKVLMSEIESGSDAVETFQESVSEYLSWLSEATGLSLNYIKFLNLEEEEEENEFVDSKWIMEEFHRYFPFPVYFR